MPIDIPVRNTVVYEPPRQDFRPVGANLTRKTASKSFIGYLNAWRNTFVRLKNPEMIVLMDEMITKFNEFYPARLNKVMNIEILEGWKNGTDVLAIWKGITNDFLIESHAKDKETGKVSTTRHEIKHEAVNRILFFIKGWEIGESHKCYDFAPVLHFTLWKDLWRERKIYFAEYYFPVKILEKLGLISYSGRGVITRIK